jgi:hypothetical protein
MPSCRSDPATPCRPKFAGLDFTIEVLDSHDPEARAD